MARFILRYAGSAPLLDQRRAQVRALLREQAFTILDESPRMFLVDSPVAPAQLAGRLPDWSLTEERTLTVPTPPVLPSSR